jgi:hypothetical protein
MTFDSGQYTTSTHQQRQDHAGSWNDWAPLLETWLGEATDRSPAIPEQADVWDEIEHALSQNETAVGSIGRSELVIAGATR